MYPGAFLATTPNKPAVIIDGPAGPVRTLTYRDLEIRSRQVSWALRGAGLQPGDVVAVVCTNVAEVFEIFWGVQRSGMYLTMINHHLTPSEVAYIVNDAKAKALFVDTALATTAEELRSLAPDVDLRVAVGGGQVDGYLDYDTLMDEQSTDEPAEQPLGNVMLYSSGTTGFPKGVKPPLLDRTLADGNRSLPMFQHLYGFAEDSVYLSPAPLYHSAPLRVSVLIHSVGGTVVVLPKFDPEACLAAIERYGVTVSQFVPTMFVRMLKLPDEVRNRYDVSSMRAAIHSAAPCPVEAKRAMIEWWGPVIHEYYAATEGLGYVVIDSEEWLRKPGSVGRTSYIGTPHICDDDGNELGPNQPGTIYFENDRPVFEYHNDPEKTRSATHPQHPLWTTAGDGGYLDEDGYLYLTDRKSFMIITGGVNIYPQEIENVLAMHPKVTDVAVIGVPHPDLGEVTKAVVHVAAGVDESEATRQELLMYCGQHLARYKVPRSLDFSRDLPRTPTGKLQKKALIERYTHA